MRLLSNSEERELRELQHLSARMGMNPLLIQGSNGNTSIKLDGILWIKASGKRLSQAVTDDIFVPLALAEIRDTIESGAEPSTPCTAKDDSRPSIETAMHAILGHRVVAHVHSTNAIAWAIRADGPTLLEERLEGLNWQWVPYAASGLPLAREIKKATRRAPETDVFVLANHGLVVCGVDCGAVEALLRMVERRLAINARPAPKPDVAALATIVRLSRWQFPDIDSLHAVGTDAVSRRILDGGILSPCQAVFLGGRMPVLSLTTDISKFPGRLDGKEKAPAFLAIEGSGTLLNENISGAELATLTGLVEVTQRIPESARISYLSEMQVAEVLSHDTYRSQEPIAVGDV